METNGLIVLVIIRELKCMVNMGDASNVVHS